LDGRFFPEATPGPRAAKLRDLDFGGTEPESVTIKW